MKNSFPVITIKSKNKRNEKDEILEKRNRYYRFCIFYSFM